jgi:hypothetical protein
MASEPTRVELDMPVVIVNKYGHLELENHKGVQDVIAPFFEHGDVLSIHVVVESTGLTRGFCDFVDPTSTYKSKCGHVLDSSGVCWMEEEHAKKRTTQLELEEDE